MRSMNDSKHILARSENYTVYHLFETVILKRPDGQQVTIGDFYGDPAAAIIDEDEKWVIVVGCGLILYRLQEPFLEYAYGTSTEQWWEMHRYDTDLWWIESVTQLAADRVQFTIAATEAHAGVYQLDLASLAVVRISAAAGGG